MNLTNLITVACESGTYKDGDMTICQTCPDGHEPNQNKTACGKNCKSFFGVATHLPFIIRILVPMFNCLC